MRRRKFLALAGVGTAIVALPGVGFVSLSLQHAAVGLITKELHYLDLDKSGVEQFVEDYLATKKANSTYALKLRTLYLLGTKARDSYLVSELTTRYLLSTDFFRNKMDEKQPVKYIGLYDAYHMPCANPFSSLYFPPRQA